MQKIIIIGLGRQMLRDHLPAVNKRSDLVISAVVEPNEGVLSSVSKELNVPGFASLQEALDNVKVDVAIISVPHLEYLPLLKLLALNGIPTLKEKPFAMNSKEAKEILELYQSHKTYFQICVQRRFSNLYETARQLINEIGDVYSLYAEYTLNLKKLGPDTLGWRADRRISGGGATLDLGYHTVDLLTNLFGMPDHIYARLNYHSLPGEYTIDDSMKAMMTYHNGKINANMLTTKIFSQKGERIRVFGVDGFVNIDNRNVSLVDRDFNTLESHSFNTKEHEVDNQLEYFISNSQKPYNHDIFSNVLLRDQLNNMRIIDAIYKSHDSGRVIDL